MLLVCKCNKKYSGRLLTPISASEILIIAAKGSNTKKSGVAPVINCEIKLNVIIKEKYK
ncbi:MAG: hypothetical protein SVZ03_09000 [Spirochaetota bacterium]|nr:hypothetical protein [Spirochaetota bacterium]